MINQQTQYNSLDKIDHKILKALQRDGRLSNTALAKEIGLSATPCSERVKSLEKLEFIEHYTAKLNPHLLQLELLVFVEISLIRTSADVFADFRNAVINLPQILECHLVSGNFDYLIKARVADMAAYRQFLGETLLRLPGVSESRTYVVMEELKEGYALPI